MFCLREHIVRGDGRYVILLHQQRDVAREGRRIAGDVDDLVGGGGKQRVDDLFVAALARRVEHDDGRGVLRRERGDFARQHLGAIAANVAHLALVAVHRGQGVRVGDRLGDDLDADDAACVLCEDVGQHARAAVCVDDGRIIERRRLECRGGIDEVAHLVVDLHERQRTDLRLDPEHVARQALLAPKAGQLAVQDHVGRRGVGACEQRKLCLFAFDRGDQLVRMRQFGAVDDDDDRIRVSDPARDEVAQKPLARALVVAGQAPLSRKGQKDVQKPRHIPVVHRAASVREWHDAVRPLGEIACDELAADDAERRLDLVAIAHDVRRRHDLVDIDLASARLGKAACDRRALDAQLFAVVDVLHVAAAALVKDGADGLDAMRRRLDQFDDAGARKAAAHLFDHHPDLFADKGARHEHDDAVMSRDALALHAGRGDLKFQNVALFHAYIIAYRRAHFNLLARKRRALPILKICKNFE